MTDAGITSSAKTQPSSTRARERKSLRGWHSKIYKRSAEHLGKITQLGGCENTADALAVARPVRSTSFMLRLGVMHLGRSTRVPRPAREGEKKAFVFVVTPRPRDRSERHYAYGQPLVSEIQRHHPDTALTRRSQEDLLDTPKLMAQQRTRCRSPMLDCADPEGVRYESPFDYGRRGVRWG